MQDSPDDWKRLIEERLENHGRKIDRLTSFQSWVLGGISAIGIFIGATINQIAHFLSGATPPSGH